MKDLIRRNFYRVRTYKRNFYRVRTYKRNFHRLRSEKRLIRSDKKMHPLTSKMVLSEICQILHDKNSRITWDRKKPWWKESHLIGILTCHSYRLLNQITSTKFWSFNHWTKNCKTLRLCDQKVSLELFWNDCVGLDFKKPFLLKRTSFMSKSRYDLFTLN